MTPFAWMGLAFCTLVWAFLITAWRLPDRYALASDSLVWAASVLSILCMTALGFHLVVAVIA